MQGMNYRLDIKKGLLVRSNDGTIASNQQSALDFTLHFFSITFYCVYFLCSGFLLILLLCINSMMCISPFISLLLQSIATTRCFNPFNKSFVLYKECS